MFNQSEVGSIILEELILENQKWQWFLNRDLFRESQCEPIGKGSGSLCFVLLAHVLGVLISALAKIKKKTNNGETNRMHIMFHFSSLWDSRPLITNFNFILFSKTGKNHILTWLIECVSVYVFFSYFEYGFYEPQVHYAIWYILFWFSLYVATFNEVTAYGADSCRSICFRLSRFSILGNFFRANFSSWKIFFPWRAYFENLNLIGLVEHAGGFDTERILQFYLVFIWALQPRNILLVWNPNPHTKHAILLNISNTFGMHIHLSILLDQNYS